MTRDELLSLPPAIAIGIIFDASANLQKVIGGIEKPKGPLPPRFDRRLRRKAGQYVWASESTLESLTFWLGKNKEGAASGNEYAEKNAKEAEQLERWVTWRTWYPDAIWNGTRGNAEVRAAPPSKHPKLHSWESSPALEQAKGRVCEVFEQSDADETGAPDDIGDFPPDYGL